MIIIALIVIALGLFTSRLLLADEELLEYTDGNTIQAPSINNVEMIGQNVSEETNTLQERGLSTNDMRSTALFVKLWRKKANQLCALGAQTNPAQTCPNHETQDLSPINVGIKGLLHEDATLSFHNYDTFQPKSIQPKKYGTTVHIEITYGNQHVVLRPYVKGTKDGETDKKQWYLTEMVIHGPSLHTIDDKRYVLEVEFIHKEDGNQDGLHVVIVSVFFNVESNDNPHLAKLLYELRYFSNPDKKETIFEKINLLGWLPQAKAEPRSYFSYYGSLMSPPCTLNIQRYLLQIPNKMSKEQADICKRIGLDIIEDESKMAEMKKPPTRTENVYDHFRP